MKSFSLKLNLLSLFAALSMSTVSATAFADVCNRVNFNSHETVLSQVQKLIPNHDTITAKDAACVLEHMHDKSSQVSVGSFLASRLENPDKLNIMLDAVKDKKTRDAITSSVKSQNHQSKADVRNDILLKDVCKKINLTPNKKQDSVYTQVKKIVKKGSTILSNDVACIIKNQTASQQKKVTEYLYASLEDPQNYTLISEVFNNKKNRENFEKSIKKKYSENSIQPPD